MNLKLELIFKDRVGIVADISTIIAQQGGNIVSMEKYVLACGSKRMLQCWVNGNNRLDDKIKNG